MKRFFLIILVAIVLTSTSCSGTPTFPKDIVDSLCLGGELPVGAVYFTEAGNGYTLTPKLLAISYGIPLDFDGIESAAVRFSSFKHPCEIAVFLCKSAHAVEDVTLFCSGRIKSLLKNSSSSSALCGMSNEDYISFVSGGIVVVSGRYVALIIAPDAQKLKRTFIRSV